jgi:hypothetical protein
MNNRTILQYGLLLYILFVTACSVPEEPVTKAEATALAASVSQAIANHNASRFNDLLDMEALEKRINNQSQNKLNRSVLEGAMKGLKSGELGRQIVRSLAEKGTYELVKQYEKNNHQHLVFRLYSGQLNYHDFELVKKKSEVKIADIYIYITGENLSSTLAQSLQSISEQASAVKNMDKGASKKVQTIKDHISKSNFEKADKLYKTLPAVFRQQKLFKIIYIQIAAGLGNDTYLAALEKFRQEYPDAANMYLLMIDAYFLKEDYAGALRCVNSLDSLINKDPFLDYYRALVYKQSEDHTNKMVCLERLHQNLPAFSDGTVELICAYVQDNQWEKAVPLTQQYRKSKDADTETIENLYLLYPDYKKKMEAATE